MEMKDYSLTCREVIDNLLMLADAYEKASAGKAPNGFAFNPTDAAANMKAAVHFIGSFGQQIPQWIPVSERLPPGDVRVLIWCGNFVDVATLNWKYGWMYDDYGSPKPTHWMPLPEPPAITRDALREQWEQLHKGPRPMPEVK